MSLCFTGNRFDLNGEPCGTVTPEQQEMAKQTLRNINKKYQAKQQAKAVQNTQ
ncbi:MAG: ProQ/FINO family protein [Plesiomonas shigelloides]